MTSGAISRDDSSPIAFSVLFSLCVWLSSGFAAAAEGDGRCVVVLGDVSVPADIAPLAARLAVVTGPANPEAADQPGAIEVVTRVDLERPEGIATLEGVAALATRHGLGLYLRAKAVVAGTWPHAVLHETRDGQRIRVRDSDEPSFFGGYAEACRDYYARYAARCAGLPAVRGIGIGLGPHGEPQFPIDGTALGDFSDTALADWRAWSASIGQPQESWPGMPALATQDTRIACDGAFNLWCWWRARRLADMLGACAQAVRAAAPQLETYCFSYLDVAAAAGYAPGFIAADGSMSWFFSSIYLAHGHHGVRDQDRSRPVAQAGTACAVELDLISAYTDPAHQESFVRHMTMMGGESRPFLATWWGPGMKGGWGGGFWTPYGDDLARAMCRAVNRNRHLRAPGVADVLVVSPSISALGAMADWGPWASQEYKTAHTDVVRHLQALGSNFDLASEESVTAAVADRYRLVVVLSPALYPCLRAALAGTRAHLLALGWAGAVVAPGPGESSSSHAWMNGERSWWPTGGAVVGRPCELRFTNHPLAGVLAGSACRPANPEPPVAYFAGLRGDPIATDDRGEAVAVVLTMGCRRLYHLGFPFAQRRSGAILPPVAILGLLRGILVDTGCTAYPDLGPLRLYENHDWLLVECPAGTTGTVAAPSGDFVGTLAPRTRHRPDPAWLNECGEVMLRIPAGSSLVIPLRAPR